MGEPFEVVANVPDNDIVVSSSNTSRTNTLGKDPIYLTPPLGQDMTQGQFLSGV